MVHLFSNSPLVSAKPRGNITSLPKTLYLLVPITMNFNAIAFYANRIVI